MKSGTIHYRPLRVWNNQDGLELRLHGDGLRSLVAEIQGEEGAAAG